jgi:hypothetical protein
MLRLFLIIVMVAQIGCAELIGFTIGTASNVTGDLIVDYMEEEKKKATEDDKEVKP